MGGILLPSFQVVAIRSWLKPKHAESQDTRRTFPWLVSVGSNGIAGEDLTIAKRLPGKDQTFGLLLQVIPKPIEHKGPRRMSEVDPGLFTERIGLGQGRPKKEKE
jgi:hypothetical protein